MYIFARLFLGAHEPLMKQTLPHPHHTHPPFTPTHPPPDRMTDERMYTVKTNVLKKKSFVVLIWKIIFVMIPWFSKLVNYILIPVAISI